MYATTFEVARPARTVHSGESRIVQRGFVIGEDIKGVEGWDNPLSPKEMNFFAEYAAFCRIFNFSRALNKFLIFNIN